VKCGVFFEVRTEFLNCLDDLRLHRVISIFLSQNIYMYIFIYLYCNEFAGSISRWNFITLKIQYTTINYNTSNTRPTSAHPISSRSRTELPSSVEISHRRIHSNFSVYIVALLEQIHCYATGTVTLLWKCNKRIVMQVLRYYGNAIECIGHATKET
jgi:hypothetical protein